MDDSATRTVEVAIAGGLDVITARRRGLEMALAMGFIQPEATKIAVVISELSRNIHNYAGLGRVILTACKGDRPYFEIIARDTGPGIPDVNKALSHGFSTSRGMGVGLPGSKRLMDEFEIQSKVGLGTTVTAKKWLR
jgi:serine/threonine-protein kinase RsbT